jgi:hypothetical protein
LEGIDPACVNQSANPTNNHVPTCEHIGVDGFRVFFPHRRQQQKNVDIIAISILYFTTLGRKERDGGVDKTALIPNFFIWYNHPVEKMSRLE